jgi:hypothetical protein
VRQNIDSSTDVKDDQLWHQGADVEYGLVEPGARRACEEGGEEKSITDCLSDNK